MTVEEVKRRVLEIAAIGNADPEAAHSAEDQLYEDVLRGIVAGDSYYISIAAEALRTKEVDFPRWCA